MYCTMDNAGPDGAIFKISLAVVILQRRKVMRCVYSFTRPGLIYLNRTMLAKKLLCFALEYIKNC